MINSPETHASKYIWLGRYWFGSKTGVGHPFTAWTTIRHDRLIGSTLEPARGDSAGAVDHQATIRGHVLDREVIFLKNYLHIEHEPVLYEGELSPDGRSVVGDWYCGWPDEKTGAFEMSLQSITADVS